jgi:hypothetical protein
MAARKERPRAPKTPRKRRGFELKSLVSRATKQRLGDLIARDQASRQDQGKAIGNPNRGVPWKPMLQWQLRPVLALSDKEREIARNWGARR